MSNWPFPGDSIVGRARKMALAYRQLATDQYARAENFREVLAQLDQRLMRFADPETADIIAVLAALTMPDPIKEMDERFRQWGETWYADVPIHHQPDDWVTAKEAGALVQRAAQTINTMRIRGRIKGRWVKGGGGTYPHWEYQVKDVYAIQHEMRGRAWRTNPTTDTVTDSGRSDTK